MSQKQPKRLPENATIMPRQLGEQFKSFKVRPNNPCLCGSGKKQKHCCGDQSKMGSMQAAKPADKPMFLYISTKWTHRDDKYFFAWRKRSSGYHFALSEMGTFNTAYADKEHVCSVPFTTAQPFFISAHIDGRKCRVLPNTAAVRKAFGISKSDLKSKAVYHFDETVAE